MPSLSFSFITSHSASESSHFQSSLFPKFSIFFKSSQPLFPFRPRLALTSTRKLLFPLLPISQPATECIFLKQYNFVIFLNRCTEGCPHSFKLCETNSLNQKFFLSNMIHLPALSYISLPSTTILSKHTPNFLLSSLVLVLHPHVHLHVKSQLHHYPSMKFPWP